MVRKVKIPDELLTSCILIGLKQENGFIFSFKGHEIDLVSCDKHRPVHVLKFIADELAERLREVHNGNIKALFGEDV